MYELVPAFLLALAATVVVSLATRPPVEAGALHAAMEPADRS
jgi:Na+/proline symporter